MYSHSSFSCDVLFDSMHTHACARTQTTYVLVGQNAFLCVWRSKLHQVHTGTTPTMRTEWKWKIWWWLGSRIFWLLFLLPKPIILKCMRPRRAQRTTTTTTATKTNTKWQPKRIKCNAIKRICRPKERLPCLWMPWEQRLLWHLPRILIFRKEIKYTSK